MPHLELHQIALYTTITATGNNIEYEALTYSSYVRAFFSNLKKLL